MSAVCGSPGATPLAKSFISQLREKILMTIFNGSQEETGKLVSCKQFRHFLRQ
jgi:hypothetical protein